MTVPVPVMMVAVVMMMSVMPRISINHRRWRVVHRGRRTHSWRRHVNDRRRSRTTDNNVRQRWQWNANVHIDARLRRRGSPKQSRRDDQ